MALRRVAGMNIIEFLEARIAEDEKTAKALLKDLQGEVQESYVGEVDEKGPMTPDRLLHAQMWAHYGGQSKRRSFAKGQQIADLASPTRVLAECAAKREIISKQDDAMDSYAGARVMDHVLQALASVYEDHPDYRQEWAA